MHSSGKLRRMLWRISTGIVIHITYGFVGKTSERIICEILVGIRRSCLFQGLESLSDEQTTDWTYLPISEKSSEECSTSNITFYSSLEKFLEPIHCSYIHRTYKRNPRSFFLGECFENFPEALFVIKISLTSSGIKCKMVIHRGSSELIIVELIKEHDVGKQALFQWGRWAKKKKKTLGGIFPETLKRILVWISEIKLLEKSSKSFWMAKTFLKDVLDK